MEIAQSLQENIMILKLKGRMDALTVANFEDIALKIPQDESVLGIVIDFKDLEYISSAGLRGLLKLAKNCRSSNKKLVCCCLGKEVSEVFRISGFNMLIKLCSNLDEALALVK